MEGEKTDDGESGGTVHSRSVHVEVIFVVEYIEASHARLLTEKEREIGRVCVHRYMYTITGYNEINTVW